MRFLLLAEKFRCSQKALVRAGPYINIYAPEIKI